MKSRPGKTVTRSISVDAETDRILREEAKAHYNGNVSTLISALTRDAGQRAAAGELLRRFAVTPMTDDEAAALLLEATTTLPKKRRKARKRGAA
jgi:hypothetical protein